MLRVTKNEDPLIPIRRVGLKPCLDYMQRLCLYFCIAGRRLQIAMSGEVKQETPLVESHVIQIKLNNSPHELLITLKIRHWI